MENTHEPVIDRATWENVQHLLRSRTKQPVVPSPANPFAGLVRCGDCGRSMAKNTWKHADGTTACTLYCGTYRRHGRRYCSPHAVPLNVLKKLSQTTCGHFCKIFRQSPAKRLQSFSPHRSGSVLPTIPARRRPAFPRIRPPAGARPHQSAETDAL